MKKILLIAAGLSMLSSEAALRLKVGVFGGLQISKIKDETNLTTHNIGHALHSRMSTQGSDDFPNVAYDDEKPETLDMGYSLKGGALFDIRILKMDHFSIGLIGQIGYGNITGSKELGHSKVAINSNNLGSLIGAYAKYSFSSSFKMGVGYGISLLKLKYTGKLSNIDDIKQKHPNLSGFLDKNKDKEFAAETEFAIGHKLITFLEYKHSKELSLLLIGDLLIGNAHIDTKTPETKSLFPKDKTKLCIQGASISLGLVYKLA